MTRTVRTSPNPSAGYYKNSSSNEDRKRGSAAGTEILRQAFNSAAARGGSAGTAQSAGSYDQIVGRAGTTRHNER